MSDPIPSLTADDAHYAEQFPLSPLDDHMIHQTPDPIRVMWTGDPRAYERYWMVCSDAAGEVVVAVGGSFYPNLDRAEAYAIVNHRGQQTSVRSFRALGADRADLRVGPIAPVIVRGLREWRYVLDENEWGISFDLTFIDTTRQVFREPLSDSKHGVPPGRRGDVTTGFEGFGTVAGWVQVGDDRIEFGEGSYGTRDRHWGTGRGVGGPTMSIGGRLHVGTNGNSFVPFDGWSLWGDRIYYPLGSPTPGATKVLKPSRRLRFEPDTQIFAEALVNYRLVTGETKQVRYEHLDHQTIYLRCGMYGGSPGSEIHQGAYDGPDMTEGDTFDVTDPRVRVGLRGLDQHVCKVTCGDETVLGIYQTLDPLAYERCVAGDDGWGLL